MADFNGDANPDIAVVHSGPADTLSVLLSTTPAGATTPSFASQVDFATLSAMSYVAIGDINTDGRPDIAVSGVSGLSVFLNTTTIGALIPSFAARLDVVVSANPRAVSVGEINGDGKPDIAVTTNFNTVAVFLNTTPSSAATASFRAERSFAVTVTPAELVLGDLDGDGKLDLAVPGDNSNVVSVLLNTTPTGATTASFASKVDFPTGAIPFGVGLGDVNRDGRADIAVANLNGGTVSMLLNTTPIGGPPSFLPKVDLASGNATSVAFGDFDRDGRSDLAATSLDGAVGIFLNTTAPGATTPTFAQRQDFLTGSTPMSVAVDDLNADGRLDLVTANQGVSLNDGSISILFAL
ncbi:MAG TPA: VCBS repeat-containing protein [Kofleriaceae bacterium]